MLLTILCIYTTAYAASVTPQTLPGNDSNPADYTPPNGCTHYEIPNSAMEGNHTTTFNESGVVDPTGDYSFTVVVGTAKGENFTKVLSWSSNFPIYAVIAKGGSAFNLYQYSSSVRSDTDLVAPDTSSGKPADVCHVSILLCPECFPPTPPTPTPTPTPVPTSTPTPTMTPTPTPTPTPTLMPTVKPIPPCPPCTPCTINISCCIALIVIFILLIIAFFLLGFLLCKILNPCCIKHFHQKEHSDFIDIGNNDSSHDNEGCNDNYTKDPPCGHDKPKNIPPRYNKNDFFQ